MQLVVSFGVKGRDRRRLAAEVGRAAEELPFYMKYPMCNYQVGELTLARDRNLIIPESVKENHARLVISPIKSMGCDAPELEVTERLSNAVRVDTLSEVVRKRLMEFVATKSFVHQPCAASLGVM